MALQSFANVSGPLITPYPHLPVGTSAATTVLDAAGESLAGIGYIQLSSGPGTSKLLSSAGGKIHIRVSGTPTFADSGTTIRVGVNDVGAAGLEDGTHDVYADLVGGTDSWTAAAVNAIAMETGSKTIADGDLVAIVVEMTARGGTDTITLSRNAGTTIMPYCTQDTGSGPTIFAASAMFAIEFNDGTIGWLGMESYPNVPTLSGNINTGTTPDEAALIFRVPVPSALRTAFFTLGSIVATEDFECLLYGDPLGTPSVIATITQDMDLAGLSLNWERAFAALQVLAANTDYGLAYRPTTAGSTTYSYLDLGAGGANLRKATMLGTNWSLGTRSNQTGAFSQDTTKLPLFGFRIAQFDDGVQSAPLSAILGEPPYGL